MKNYFFNSKGKTSMGKRIEFHFYIKIFDYLINGQC